MMIKEALSRVFSAVGTVRNALYDMKVLPSYRVSIPVISVGNITCGGTGKTPLSMFIAEELLKLGYRPVLLAKGYKGRLKGPHIVDTTDTFESVGDEALLMYRRTGLVVVISHNKTAGARFIDKHALGDIIVLDDGYQHRRLARDADILCVNAVSKDAIDTFLEGKVLPAGPFRESRENGMLRADIIVLSFRRILDVQPYVDHRLWNALGNGRPLFFSSYSLEPARSIENGSVLPPGDAVACCSLANPQGFFESFSGRGYRLKASYAFPDHDPGFASKVAKVRKEHPELPILCTEKDAVKLSGKSAEGVFYTPVQVNLRHSFNIPFIGAVLNVVQDKAPLPGGACRLIGKKNSPLHLERVVIESERLRIEPVSARFTKEIFTEFTREIAVYMMPKPAEKISETEAFVRLCQERLHEGRDLTMVILDKKSGEFLGCCGLHEREDVVHPELGIWVKKSAHGHHYGREAVTAVVKWAEENLRWEYLIYPVDRRNIASRKIPESLGGVVFKEKMEQTAWGGMLDEVVYMIPKSEAGSERSRPQLEVVS